MPSDAEVQARIAAHGFSFLGFLSSAHLNKAKSLLPPAPPPGQADLDIPNFPGLDFLATATGFYDQANRLVKDLSPPWITAQLTRRVGRRRGTPHLDGFYPNGSRDLIETPDAVLGVYLSDVPNITHGAFTVWAHNREAIKEWFCRYHTLPPKVVRYPGCTGVGVPVIGPPGTAFLLHGAVLHCQEARIAGSGSRDAVFFRLNRNNRNVLGLLRSGGKDWDYP